MLEKLVGYRTIITAILTGVLETLRQYEVPVPKWLVIASAVLTAIFLRLGMKTEAAKASQPPIVVPLLLVAALALGACSTQPIDQMAGQQPVRVVASAWNSTATTEAPSQLRDTLGQGSEGVEVPVIDKAGNVVLDKDGKPVLVRVGRGLRDINFFFGEVKVENSSSVQGTTSGTGQTGTPTTTVSPPVNVSGVPK